MAVTPGRHLAKPLGIIPAPFLGEGKYLFDVQNHTKVADKAQVEKGQLLVLNVPPGQPVSK